MQLVQWISNLLAEEPISVVETHEFTTTAGRLFSPPELAALVDYLAYHPTAGEVVPGTGGIRKMRWGIGNRGKRGAARVVYFYHGNDMPLFALTAYAKNEQTDLSFEDKARFRLLTSTLVSAFRRPRQ